MAWPMRRRGAIIVTWLALLTPLVLGGCFLVSRAPDRPGADSVSGPAVYAENCVTCHAARTATYAESLHATKGIKCGQCHAPHGHPNFERPVRDGTCGGCHQAEFQQTLASTHFAIRESLALDSDRAARAALRGNGFRVPPPAGQQFAGDAASGEMGGRLCAACHYDEHRLGLRAVQRADFCVGCHTGREQHYPVGESTNRCVTCHVRAGETVGGQVVNTHLFAPPGGGK